MRTIGLKEVQMKAEAAMPRILMLDKAYVSDTLNEVKAEILPGTPTGPGHFGYHLRDTYRVEVASEGTKTSGSLKAAVQGYWREFGTGGRFRGASKALRGYIGALTRQGGTFGGTGGEKAGLYATRALSMFKRFLRAYYGEGQWWRLP